MSGTVAPDELIRVVRAGIQAAKDKAAGVWFGGEGKAASLANLEDLSKRVDKWATEYRRWAEQGFKGTTGSKYSWADWAAFGNERLADAGAQGGYAVEGGQRAAIAGAIVATAADTKRLAGQAVDAATSGAKWAVVALVAAAVIFVLLRFRGRA